MLSHNYKFYIFKLKIENIKINKYLIIYVLTIHYLTKSLITVARYFSKNISHRAQGISVFHRDRVLLDTQKEGDF